MTKEYEHKSDLEDEVEVPLDKDWKAPKEEDLKVEVEEEAPEKPKEEAKEEPEEEEEEAPAPPRTDPAVLALRQQIEEMNRREAEREAQNLKTLSEREDQELNAKLAAARAKLKKAQEDGNTDAASEATEELTDIKVELKARQLTRQAPPEPRQQQYQQPNPLTPRWLQKNDWYGKQGYEEETFAARVIDAKMVQEGYDPNTEEYFDELAKRLKSKFRTIEPVGFKPPKKKETTPPMAPARQAPKTSRPGVVRLTKQHFELMRMSGLDPDKGEDRQIYARQIKEYGDPLENN